MEWMDGLVRFGRVDLYGQQEKERRRKWRKKRRKKKRKQEREKERKRKALTISLSPLRSNQSLTHSPALFEVDVPTVRRGRGFDREGVDAVALFYGGGFVRGYAGGEEIEGGG